MPSFRSPLVRLRREGIPDGWAPVLAAVAWWAGDELAAHAGPVKGLRFGAWASARRAEGFPVPLVADRRSIGVSPVGRQLLRRATKVLGSSFDGSLWFGRTGPETGWASFEAQITSCGVLERHVWTAADAPSGDLLAWAGQHEYTPLWWRRRLVGVSLSELLDAVVDAIELMPGSAPTAALSELAPLDDGMVSRAHLRGVALRYGLPGDIQGRLFEVAAERRERLLVDGVQLARPEMVGVPGQALGCRRSHALAA